MMTCFSYSLNSPKGTNGMKPNEREALDAAVDRIMAYHPPEKQKSGKDKSMEPTTVLWLRDDEGREFRFTVHDYRIADLPDSPAVYLFCRQTTPEDWRVLFVGAAPKSLKKQATSATWAEDWEKAHAQGATHVHIMAASLPRVDHVAHLLSVKFAPKKAHG
jgi:hypothetical protein